MPSASLRFMLFSYLIRHVTFRFCPLLACAPCRATGDAYPDPHRSLHTGHESPPFVSPLEWVLTDSVHPDHSTPLSRPLFSYSYALFCTRRNANAFVFKHSRTPCEKQGDGGIGSHSGTSRPRCTKELASNFPASLPGPLMRPVAFPRIQLCMLTALRSRVKLTGCVASRFLRPGRCCREARRVPIWPASNRGGDR